MIEIQGLRKRFGDLEALAGISLAIGQGEIFGYIGPNGAGKTTTLRILATVQEADEGSVRVRSSARASSTLPLRARRVEGGC